jgi:hypothetical protein
MASAMRFTSLFFLACATSACAELQGLGSYHDVPCLDDCPRTPTSNGQTTPSTDGSVPNPNDPNAPNVPPPPVGGKTNAWAYHRAITMTSDVPAPLPAEPVLVVLPEAFDTTHTKANGDDLRFSTNAAHEDDLPYFIESWSPGGKSIVWVKVPSVPNGVSTLHVFYGNASAPAASSFATTFPKARRTAGAGAGSFTASGDIDVDWFELRAGDTLTLASGVPLKISARRVIIAGTIEGSGRGFGGGLVPSGAGDGPGGGKVANPSDTEGSGGGGHGGDGGRAGNDVVGAGGTGGPAYGSLASDDITMGSGGGSTKFNAGGAGGGAIAILGFSVTMKGVVRVNGLDGGGGADRNSGGGAGGGVLIGGSLLDLGGATFFANGGAGGMCTAPAHDGGGGGGGGRIKLRHRASGSITMPAQMSVAFGPGGTGAGTTAPGLDGQPGTTHVDGASLIVRGVDTVLGPEEILP